MCQLKSTSILILFLLSLAWPSVSYSPGWLSPSTGSDGGGKNVNYLAVFGGPERVPDLVRPDPVDLPPVDGPGVLQVPEAPLPRAHPTTRGGLRVWLTHYAAEDLCSPEQIRRDQCITASGHPLRVGYAAGYPVRAGRDIVGANLRIPGLPELPFGAVLAVQELGEVTIMDTGLGYPDGRPWLDVAVADHDTAVRLGAGWREVKVLHD